jgi:hypothetical protein
VLLFAPRWAGLTDRDSGCIAPCSALELLSPDADGIGHLLKERVSDLDELSFSVERTGHGSSVLDPAVVGELVGRRRQADNPLEELTKTRTRSPHADSRGTLEPRDRGAAVHHRAHDRNARQEHPPHAASAQSPDDHRRVLAIITCLNPQ